MIKIPSLAKTYNFLKKYYPVVLGIILALLICFNLFIYYQYVYLTIRSQAKPSLEKVTIDQEILEEVLNNLNVREETLWRIEDTGYVNPFKKP